MKRKTLNKVLAASLVVSMTAGLAGCGSDNASTSDTGSTGNDTQEPVADTNTDSSDTEVVDESGDEVEEGGYVALTDENGNVYDLGGMEVIIRDWWSSGEEAEPTDAFEEARQEYQEWVQETYNFTLKQIQISDWGSTPEDFLNYVTSGGDDNNYVWILRKGPEFVSAMNNGLMYDLSTLDCLDFSEAKWVSGVHELCSKNGAIYACFTEIPEPRGGVFFNK